jgi:uncharacterized protein (DUF983 family)
MNNKEKAGTPSIIHSIAANKCPHCRQGDLFLTANPYDLKNTMKMPDHCPVCGQPYELHTGFYFGTGYVSYALSVIILIMSAVVWAYTIGFSVHDNSVFWWLGCAAFLLIILQPMMQRIGRSVWIHCFVRYDKDWALHNKLKTVTNDH